MSSRSTCCGRCHATAARATPCRPSLRQRRALDRRFDAAVDALTRDLAADAIDAGAARRIAQSLSLAMQASLLIRHAPPAIADGFCASRLAERPIRRCGVRNVAARRRYRGDRCAGSRRGLTKTTASFPRRREPSVYRSLKAKTLDPRLRGDDADRTPDRALRDRAVRHLTFEDLLRLLELGDRLGVLAGLVQRFAFGARLLDVGHLRR